MLTPESEGSCEIATNKKDRIGWAVKRNVTIVLISKSLDEYISSITVRTSDCANSKQLEVHLNRLFVNTLNL